MNSLVQARGLCRRYGRFWALRDLDLSVEPGTALAVLGANGAGKSTLLSLLATLHRPSSGQLTLLGCDPRREAAKVRAGLGHVGHATLLDDTLTARENLRFHAGLFGLDDPGEQIGLRLEQLGLAHRADTRVDAFSRGMRQRLTLARALLHRPSLLVLDEPFTGLDHRGSGELAAILAAEKERGCAIVLATHQLEHVLGWTDRVLVLDRGRAVEEAAAHTRDAAGWLERVTRGSGEVSA